MSFRAETKLLGTETSHPLIGVHQCKLPATSDHTMSFQFTEGPLKQFVQFVKRLSLPSYRHKETKYHFRSNRRLMTEYRRTLNYTHPAIVHPFSVLSLIRDVLMAFVWVFLLYYRPYRMASMVISDFSGRFSVLHVGVTAFTSLVLMANIAFNFFIGFENRNNKKIVLDHDQIIRSYCKTYLAFDCLDCVPFQAIYAIFGTNPWVYVSLMGLHLSQMVRIRTMIACYRSVIHVIKLSTLWSDILFLVIVASLFLHWGTCTIMTWSQLSYLSFKYHGEHLKASMTMISRMEIHKKPDYLKYVLFLHKITVHFMNCGVGAQKIRYTVETLIMILACLVGVCFKIYIMVYLLTRLMGYKKSESRFDSFYKSQVMYLNSRKLSNNLKSRVYMFFRFKYTKQFFDFRKIESTLSDHLRNEMFLTNCAHLIVNLDLVRGLRPHIVGEMIMDFIPKVYLAGDVFFKANEKFTELHMILYGRAAVYTDEGMEVLHYSDGALLGIGGLYIGYHTWNMVAIDTTEALVWYKEDVDKMKTKYPELNRKLRESFSNRVDDVLVYSRVKKIQKNVTKKMQALLAKKKILEQKVTRRSHGDGIDTP